MNSRTTLTTGAVLLALATLCGALGAHALAARLPPERAHLWDTAARYHFLQSLGLMVIGLCLRAQPAAALRGAAALMVAGVVLFSGSLYALALGAPAAFGLLTPLGGLAWIAAWLLLAIGVWRQQARE
ncbi:MAG TPA: DUF423 domain-containing protein [Steroidobacteraceae bacterium]|nr:DUF423 domain-containing protein [Steroidobacteraceae bacterium]